MNRILILPTLLLALVLAAGCTKEAKRTRLLARAEQDFKAERYDRAEIEYLAALRLPPFEPIALQRVGEIYCAQGKYPQSCGYLQKCLEAQSGNVPARARLAKALLLLGKMNEAREQALRVLKNAPEQDEALFVLAETTVSAAQAAETAQRLEAAPPGTKTTAPYHVAAGVLHLRMGQLDQAEEEFSAALKADPESSQAHFGLGNLFLARTNIAQAEAELKRAAEGAPARSTIPLMFADLKLKTGRRDEARRQIEQLTVKTPDYLPAWLFLAQMDFAEQSQDACGKILDRVLVRDPINLEALTLRGDIFLARRDLTNAVSQFEKALKIYGKVSTAQYKLAVARLQMRETARAMALLNELLANDPGFTDAVLLKASLLTRSGDARAAIPLLSRLIQERPELYQAHLLLVDAYLSQKALQNAADACQHMQMLFSRSPEPAVLLGTILLQQGKSADARTAFEGALQIVPEYLPAHEQVIDLDLAESKPADAINRVEKLIARAPATPEPWLLAAKVHSAQALSLAGTTNLGSFSPQDAARFRENPAASNECFQAEAALLKAIELRPGLDVPQLMLAQLYVRSGRERQAIERLALLSKTNHVGALMQLGLLQVQLNNFTAARDAYEQALKVNPDLAAALNNLAFLYCEQLGQTEKAYEMAQKARQLLPNDPRIADTLGWVLYHRGEFGQALGLLRDAASQLPAEADTQFHLGMVYYRLGQEELSRDALGRAAAAASGSPWKADAEKRLRLLNLDPAATDAAAAGPLLTELKQTLTADPNDTIALLRVAQLEQRAGNYPQARTRYEAFLRAHPDNVRVLLMLAKLYSENLNESTRAFDLFKQAHNLAPDDAEINYALGRLAFANHDYTWAANLLQDVGRKLPERPEVAYHLAWALYSIGRVQEAIASMQRAAEHLADVKLNDAKLFLRMASAVEQPDIAKSIVGKEANALLDKDPGWVPALYLVGRGLEQQADFAGARQMYERALGVFPGFTPAIRQLAALFAFHLGDVDKGYGLASKAREAFPQDPEVARTLGILSVRRAENQRGIELLSESVRARPDDGEAYYYIGLGHCGLKHRTESVEALRRALDLKLDPKLAAEARLRLQELGENL